MLAAARVRFEAVVPAVDEDDVKARGGTARDISETLARLKAMVERRTATLVIGADQTLELDGHSISKAASIEELRANLLRLRGRTHALHSAVAVAGDGGIVWNHIETARLTMRDFSDVFLDDYISRNGEAVRSSLGGYWFEGEGAQLFDLSMATTSPSSACHCSRCLASCVAKGFFRRDAGHNGPDRGRGCSRRPGGPLAQSDPP